MPFGLKNVLAQFQRYVNEVLSDSAVAYMDFPQKIFADIYMTR